MVGGIVDDNGGAQAHGDSEGLHTGDSEWERLYWRQSDRVRKDDCVCGSDAAEVGAGSFWDLWVDFDAYEVCVHDD